MLTETQSEIIATLKNEQRHGNLSSVELSEKKGIGISEIESACRSLVNKGYLLKIAGKSRWKSSRWCLSELGWENE
jgi:hypothetical protein